MKKDFFYLESLSIKNFATFDYETISFCPTFNAIIGETGSGKSLILDALQLIFGARSDKKMIRKGKEQSIIEAVFLCQDKSILHFLSELGFPVEENHIIIKRTLDVNGNSRSFLNHQTTNLATLQKFFKKYIDWVGQFENQKILENSYQMSALDQFAQTITEKNEYQKEFQALTNKKNEFKKIIEQKNISDEQEDFLNFVIEEISEAHLSETEEEALLQKKNLLQNSEQRKNTQELLLHHLKESSDNTSAIDLIKNSIKIVEKNKNLYPSSVSEQLLSAINHIETCCDSLTAYEELEANETLETVLDRLDTYQKIKRKYGGTILSALERLDSAKKQMNFFNNFTEEINRLQLEIETCEKNALVLAEKLHLKRLKKSKELSTLLSKELGHLKMQGATIKIEIMAKETLGWEGLDDILITAETNPGEGFYPINSIASGGELSRILLALRQILSSKDDTSLFLFDEIDTGMGGETALCIGKTLQAVSQNSQVIAITHLPQIAHCAEKLIIVSKESSDSKEGQRTFSSIREVQGLEKKKEIHQMVPLS